MKSEQTQNSAPMEETSEREFKIIPLWMDLEAYPTDESVQAIRTACPQSLIEVVSKRCPSKEMTKIIVSIWADNNELIEKLVTSIAIDDEIFEYLLSLDNQTIYSVLVKRNDTKPAMLHRIAKKIGNDLSRYNHRDEEILERIISHKKCSPKTLLHIYQKLAFYYSDSIFKAPKIPKAIQQLIILEEHAYHLLKLLKHPSLCEELLPDLFEEILESEFDEAVSAALVHPEFPNYVLPSLLFHPSFRIAALAADQISLAQGSFRLREFAEHHLGFSGPQICNLLNTQIEKGLPLGYFVIASVLLTGIFPGDHNAILECLQDLSKSEKAGTIREIGRCDDSSIKSFLLFFSKFTRETKIRLFKKSLQIGFDRGLIYILAKHFRSRAFNEIFQNLKMAEVEDLSDLCNKIEEMRSVFKDPNKPLKQDQKARWLLDVRGTTLSSGHIIEYPKMTLEVWRWGVALKNCLKTKAYMKRIESGESIVLGLFNENRIEYAVSLNISGNEIYDEGGFGNRPIPIKIKEELLSHIRNARKGQINLPSSQN